MASLTLVVARCLQTIFTNILFPIVKCACCLSTSCNMATLHFGGYRIYLNISWLFVFFATMQDLWTMCIFYNDYTYVVRQELITTNDFHLLASEWCADITLETFNPKRTYAGHLVVFFLSNTMRRQSVLFIWLPYIYTLYKSKIYIFFVTLLCSKSIELCFESSQLHHQFLNAWIVRPIVMLLLNKFNK